METEIQSVPANIIYDSLLKNEKTSEYLSLLADQAEDFNSKKSKYDVIKEYLKSSRNCQELLPFIKDWSNADLKDAVSLMKVLCHILIRVASDLNAYDPAGSILVNEILSHGMKIVFNFLQFKQKASRTKLALNLLLSMVALGKITAFKVVAKLNFSNANFVHLLGKRNFSEDEDTRTVFLNFLVLILSKCDDNVIRQIVEINGFLNRIIPGLVSDRPQTIVHILRAFRQHIIENKNISKNSKLRLFNDYSIKPIIELYLWKGPLRRKINQKRKLGEDDNPVAFEVTDEEASDVHQVVHDFMLALCCNHDSGIINKDPSFGLSGKNVNPVITKILKNIPTPYVDAKMSELVVSVIQACPDQLGFYIPFIKDSFMPRLSQSWLDMSSFLKKLMLSQDPVAALFHSESKNSVTDLLKIGSIVCLLDIVNVTVVKNTLLHGHHVLSYYVCDFLLSILNQVKVILNFSLDQKSSKIYETSDIKKFQQSFQALINLRLPVTGELQIYLKEITSKTNESNSSSCSDVAVPSLGEELLLIFKLIRAFQMVSPENLAMNWSAIFTSMKTCDARLSSDELSSVYICMIDILVDEDYPILGSLKTDLLLMMIGDIFVSSLKSKSTHGDNIVHKIFLHTKVFDNCKWEIPVWIYSLKSLKTKHIPPVLRFINLTMHSLFANPEKFSVQPSIISTKQNGINEHQHVTPEDSNPTKPEQCFSSFCLAALHELQSLNKEGKKGCQRFVEEALTHIIHSQHDLTELYLAVKPYKSVLNSSIMEYFDLLSTGRFESLIMKHTPNNCTLDLVGHLKCTFMCNLSADSNLETCHCDTSALLENLDPFSIRNVICQVLTYLNFEVNLLMGKRTKETSALGYINLLEKTLNCLSLELDSSSGTHEMAISSNENFKESSSQEKSEILKLVLNHPIILRLFLGMSAKSLKHFQNCSLNATKLVDNIVKKVTKTKDKSFLNLLKPYKDKIMEALQGKSYTAAGELEIHTLVSTFSILFDSNDIRTSLENLLCSKSEQSKNNIENLKSLFILLELFFQNKDTLPLSPGIVNFLISKYVVTTKKQKKEFRKYLKELFMRFPVSALFLNEDSSQLFIQHKTTKDLSILRLLIHSNDAFRQAVQNFTLKSLDIDSFDFIYLTSTCLNSWQIKKEADNAYKEAISSKLWKTLTAFLLDAVDVEEEDLKESQAGQAAQMLILENYISSKKLKKFRKLCLDQLQNTIPIIPKTQIILQLLYCQNHESDKDGVISSNLKIGLHCLASLISDNFCFWDLTHFIQELLKDASGLVFDELIDLEDFFTRLIEISFENETIGKEIFKILCLLCEKCQPESLPVKKIYKNLVTDPMFFPIMVAENFEKSILKEYLIDLLTVLIELDGKKICKENDIGLYLASYGGTMSSVDQKIIYLIKLYADNNTNMIKYRPFLWGKQAIAHYSSMKDSNLHLLKQPKLQDVLSGFLAENIELTVLNFPLKATLMPTRQVIEVEGNVSDKIYDFRYYLPQFATLLSPESFVHCNSLFESKVMMLILISLSSYDPNTRAVGYYCLTQLYHHLEGANFKDKEMWIFLLDSLRNSITSLNPRLPSIITIFLARVFDIFTKPDHPMYIPLYKFITVKPYLDITQVPEYFKLFNSPDIEHRIHRQWLLSLISDGLQTSLDFHLCEKRYIFSTLMTYYFGCLSTEPEKVLILKAIQNAVKTPSTAKTMCQNGLLVWLNLIIEESNFTQNEIANSFCSIMDNLMSTVKASNEDSQNSFDISSEFKVVHFSLLKKLSFHDLGSVKKCISALYKSVTAETDNMQKPQLSFYYAAFLLDIWKKTFRNLNENNKCLIEDKDNKELFLSFAKIIVLWEPSVSCENNDVYEKNFNYICDFLELLSLSCDDSVFYLYELPHWLQRYVVKLDNQRLEQFLTTRDCFKLVLKLYEKSLTPRCINNKELTDSSVSQSNPWGELLHCFKDLSHPVLIWFKHIWNALSL